jgi:hypothetical protein
MTASLSSANNIMCFDLLLLPIDAFAIAKLFSLFVDCFIPTSISSSHGRVDRSATVRTSKKFRNFVRLEMSKSEREKLMPTKNQRFIDTPMMSLTQ